ncbi:MAG: nucleotidyltransferase domain-containing protein [Chloroflexi bacterium]|nr:MAG: nucleotidyltransferase domain-containing protein [Chloroflexota bacterium]
MQAQADVRERYQAALAQLVSKLEEDYYVLAAVLFGSVARGEAWERSDIDLFIVLRDGLERETRHLWVVEDDINIMADVLTRNQFKRALERTLQGSWLHSIRSQFQLLLCKDESIASWLNESDRVGAHDQELQLLRTAAEVPWTLDKATKWFYIKRDLNYALVWILQTVNTLARLEVLLNGVVPGREALDQALKYNPVFFEAVYTGLINGPKTEDAIGAALERIDGYLAERADRVFKPVLDYLAQANGLCTAAEMSAYFKKKVQVDGLGGVYEWLARRGMIQKLSSPTHLTRKSQVTLDEPAYYYDSVNLSDWE